LVDRLEAEGLRVFGPCRAAARLEGSKAFAKDVMKAGGVPTGWAEEFTALAPALACVRERGAPIVIKADGLAAGKGVAVCSTVAEAEEALRAALEQKVFGEAGATVLVEEHLSGQEASILGLVDGSRVVLLASSQDHKRAWDGDRGPNTGGMGAYSPAPLVAEAMWPAIREQVFQRTLDELNRRGIVFKGVLYAGLMIDGDAIKVLEFNVRFGDPEMQCILPRLEGDLLPALESCVDGTLREELVRWKEDACVCVVMAAGGYPGAYAKGREIRGLAEAGALEGVTVFHAGTALDGNRVVTAGGRVLGVTALGSDLKSAVDTVYHAVDCIHWEDAHVRRDIAAKAFPPKS
jgi:phosphoribosylamine--glycine ligase